MFTEKEKEYIKSQRLARIAIPRQFLLQILQIVNQMLLLWVLILMESIFMWAE